YGIGASSQLVEYRGPLDRLQVAELFARSQIGLVVLHPTGNYVNAQPTKLFEYMSSGLPVVASNFPLCKQIADSARCGLTVDPMDAAAIAGAMLWLFENKSEAEEMGRNGQRAVVERYSWERESERLLTAYAQVRPAKRMVLL